MLAQGGLTQPPHCPRLAGLVSLCLDLVTSSLLLPYGSRDQAPHQTFPDIQDPSKIDKIGTVRLESREPVSAKATVTSSLGKAAELARATLELWRKLQAPKPSA